MGFSEKINCDLWLSQKGINYILSPKRGAWTTINPDVCQALTAKGQENWIGTFISPNIDHISRDPIQGGAQSDINLYEGWNSLFLRRREV